jgi:DNA-directed RNA polymerase subunit RPC12/RpoP
VKCNGCYSKILVKEMAEGRGRRTIMMTKQREKEREKYMNT